MTPYASLALIRRNGAIVFRPPRKERPDDITQARKAAFRYWRSSLTGDDVLVKVIVMREFAGNLEISERGASDDIRSPWTQYETNPQAEAKEPHLAACMAELGIDPSATPASVPDVLEINGFIYRREI